MNGQKNILRVAGCLMLLFLIAVPPAAAGLAAADGTKITTTDGATSVILTITDAEIVQDDTIFIDITGLDAFTASKALTTANIVVMDNAAAATWTGSVDAGYLTLVSTDGATQPDETVTITFTGAFGNPWIDGTDGEQTLPLFAARNDGAGDCSFNFVIEIITLPPGNLAATGGAKITSPTGSTTASITILDADIAEDSTITIDLAPVNAFAASGALTTANINITDNAAAAVWTGTVAGSILTLRSTGGATAHGESVSVNFTGAAGNPWIADTGGIRTQALTATRTDNGKTAGFDFIIETGVIIPAPVAEFVAAPVSGYTPLTVVFNDTSSGNPATWKWNFGDGSVSALQNPVHVYTTAGKFTVSLNASNAGGSSVKSKSQYITAITGGTRVANTTIAGLTVTGCGSSPQTVTVDTSLLSASLIPNNSVLEIRPPPDRGFGNITIYATGGAGFSRAGSLITGTVTGARLVTEEIKPPLGFSNPVGAAASFNYSVDLAAFPCNALLTTEFREGITSADDLKLRQIAAGNSAGIVATAYTVTITKTGIPATTTGTIHMSVNSSWNPSLSGGPGKEFIWRFADDGNSGEFLPTGFLSFDPATNLEYLEAASPRSFSTFGLSSVSGNNNPFQMVTFAISETISSPSSETDSSAAPSTGKSTAPEAVQNPAVPESKAPPPADPGKSAALYLNADAVITQETILQSNDKQATLSIRTGIVAKDAENKPLASVMIARLPDPGLPPFPSGSGVTYTGMAYELQPDGATFSPSVTISFAKPDTGWSDEYIVRTYDREHTRWVDLPTSYDPGRGTISAAVDHFCTFAVFSKAPPAAATKPATGPVLRVTLKAPAPPAPTAMSTFIGMVMWLVDIIMTNIIVIAGVIVLVVALFLYDRKRRRDRWLNQP